MTEDKNVKKSLLMKKTGQALTFLTGEMLGCYEGERLPTFSQFADKSGFSRGTLQSALAFLEQMGAVSLNKRGHMGTFLEAKNTTLLLEYGALQYIAGIMPLPYTIVYEGLATGIYNASRTHYKLPVNLAYMRGSERRIQNVLDRRYDFAITSRLAANAAIEKGYPIEIIKDFGASSYLSGHSIVFHDERESVIRPGMKIGVDRISLDHVRLSKLAVGDCKVEFVDLNYSQIMKLILDGRIDAAVWNIDNVLERYTAVNHVPFSGGESLGEDIAVMLVAKDNKAVSVILDECIDIADVLEQQQKVIRGEIYPNY